MLAVPTFLSGIVAMSTSPLDGMLVYCKVFFSQHYIPWYPFMHLSGERHFDSKVPCPREHQNIPGQDLNPDREIRSRLSPLTLRPARLLRVTAFTKIVSE